MLNDEQLGDLWRRFGEEGPGWRLWHEASAAFVAEIRGMDEEALRQPEAQERLWEARVICGLGSHEQIQLQSAWSDEALVEALVALRRRRWSPRVEDRAQELEDVFGELLGLASRHTNSRPQARIQRLMVALAPEELHCVVSWGAGRELAELLLPDRRGRTPVAAQVLVRARLREALGAERDLAEHVGRSLFCWWLHGQAEALRWQRGAAARRAESGASGEDSGRLRLWPPSRQHKGLPLPARGPGALRDVVRLASDGLRVEELVEVLGADPHHAGLSLRGRRQLVQLARRLGLLEVRGSELVPSEAGEELLEREPIDPLTGQALRRVYGLAQALAWLCRAEGSLDEGALEGWMGASLPGWASTWTAPELWGWLEGLGLAQRDRAGRLVPTAQGRAWGERLPEALPAPQAPATNAPSRRSGGAGTLGRGLAPAWPGLEEIRRSFTRDAEVSRLVLDESALRALHLGWHSQPSKRFVILSGLSGTGKTALLASYARLTCKLLGLEASQHLEIVAVSPEWRDPSGLLGYFSALHQEPAFHAEPALRLLLRAVERPLEPFFLLLDEMNLARVERYLAPLLSAMETGEALSLHPSAEVVDGVPPEVPWPRNLFLGGTVNMDETTHPFSDKVLDRAFTLELWEADLPRYFARRAQLGEVPQGEAERVLLGMYEALRPSRRHFGYRSAGEVLSFVQVARREAGGEALWQEALDQAILSKILPKIRGEDSPALRRALEQAREVCQGLPRSAGKLDEMRERLARQGVTRFWA